MSAKPSWISQERPEVPKHLTSAVVAVLEQVVSESKDTRAQIYTQAEMVRAIEIAMGKADPLDQAIEDNGGRFTL